VSVTLRVHALLCVSTAPSEPLLCKFADGGQKKRQSQNKYVQNGRGWARDGDSRLVSTAVCITCHKHTHTAEMLHNAAHVGVCVFTQATPIQSYTWATQVILRVCVCVSLYCITCTMAPSSIWTHTLN